MQAQIIGQMLTRCHAGLNVQYEWVDSEGDQQTNTSLAAAGGKGLFTAALERALLAERVDVAVHSMKDLPVAGAKRLTIAAVPQREDVRDCLIAQGPATLDELPAGSRLGTSSPRRAAQVKRHRPDLHLEAIRGNVDTRLRKVLEHGQYNATLLAMAGLRRLGMPQHMKHPITLDVILPAAGQGALAIQCRSDDSLALTRCMQLNHACSAEAVHAERQIVKGLKADCHSPIAVLAEAVQVEGWPGLRIRVRVLSADGLTCLEIDQCARARNTRQMIKRVLADLLERGADTLLGRT